MKKHLLNFLLAACLLFTGTTALAAFDPVNDDTDIFLANPAVAAQRPNVLIILDNTANWNNAFDNEKSALVQVVNSLSDMYNVGLMMFPETGGGNDSIDGGYVRFGVRQMTIANKTALSTMVNNLHITNDKGNNATTGLAMHEAYLYYAGRASIASYGKVKTDFAGNAANNPLAAGLAGNALPASPTSASLYNSPVVEGCQKNFIIYISNGPAAENASARSEAQAYLAALVGENPPDTIALSPNGLSGNWADEFAQYMADPHTDVNTGVTGNQQITTYTIEVNPGTTGQEPDMTALLKSMANVGQGKYFGVSDANGGASIVDALNRIFTEVQAVNSVFASTTLPVSVNVRGTNLNQVYIGVFRPDANKGPRWMGNLKLYNLALNAATGSVYLSDQLGLAAEDTNTHFITQSATSFWTSDTLTPTNFWSFSPRGFAGASDSPDGELVEKGGVAQQLRHEYQNTQTGRDLYTCTTGCNRCTMAGASPSKTCTGGSALSGTLFNADNADINTGTLQLETRSVASLTGNQSLSVTNLERRREVTLDNFWNNVAFDVTLSNGAASRATITSLSTSRTVALSSITAGSVGSATTTNGNLTWTLVLTHNSGNTAKWSVATGAAPAAPGGGTYTSGPTITNAVSGNLTILSMSGTCTGIATPISIGTGAKDIDAGTGPSTATTGEVTATGASWSGAATCTVTATLASTFTSSASANLTSTTATATSTTPHGFVNGQIVTVSPANSTFNQSTTSTGVSVPATCNAAGVYVDGSGTNPCLYRFTYTLATAAFATDSSGAAGTAGGLTTTATATATAHGYATGNSVTIYGAIPSGYNGAYTVTVVDANTFTYTVASSLTANTSATVYAYMGAGSSTVTATATSVAVIGAAPYNLMDGQILTISGADVAGYNSSYTISCSPGGGLACNGNTFTFTTTTLVGGVATPAVLPPTVFTAPATSILAAGLGNSYTGIWMQTTPDPVTSETRGHYFGSYYNYTNWSFQVPVIIERTDGIGDCFTGEYSAANQVSDSFWGSVGGAYISSPHRLMVVMRPKAACGAYDPANAATWWGVPTPTPGATYTVRLKDYNLAYAKTAAAHNYPTAQSVTIAGATPTTYNGTYTIKPGADDTTINNPQGWWGAITDPYTKEFVYATPTLPTASGSGTLTSTIMTTTAFATATNHGLGATNTTLAGVTIAGATPAAFNGSKTVLITGADTFLYCLSTPDTVPVYVGGLITPASCAAGTPQGDASGTMTAATAVIANPAENESVINWVRGQDNFENENQNLLSGLPDYTDIRASVHGDVLHSRPAVINYNRWPTNPLLPRSNNDVYVFYGANDGIFHAVQGGMAADADDPDGLTGGQEVWGFVPQEFFPSLKRLRNNSPMISSSNKKPYFADGPIGVYAHDTNGDDKLSLLEADEVTASGDIVNLYIGMRRGGRFIYSLNVTDPSDPKLNWKISNTTAGFEELGQTWSETKVIEGMNGYTNPVLIFGAGYDSAVEDINPSAITVFDDEKVNATNRSMGRGIYVVDAITGEKIVSIGGSHSQNVDKVISGMDYAIPSDVTVIKNLSGGQVNRAYVGDTGGNVWRLDFAATYTPTSAATRSNWVTVTKIASVGGAAMASFSAANLRKFFFPPDVVEQSGFDAILMGSGDREHPFDTTVVNRMYMFKDKGSDAGPLTGTIATLDTIKETAAVSSATNNWLYDATDNCIQQTCAGNNSAGVPYGTTTVEAGRLTSAFGWYITLRAGEKVIGNAVALGGTVFFNTNQPATVASSTTCESNLGIARQYQVAVADATAVTNLDTSNSVLNVADRSVEAGGGYLPSPVHVVVQFTDASGNTVTKEAVISGTQVSMPTQTPLMTRFRKYWYKEIDQ